jgi:hypothetical protein
MLIYSTKLNEYRLILIKRRKKSVTYKTSRAILFHASNKWKYKIKWNEKHSDYHIIVMFASVWLWATKFLSPYKTNFKVWMMRYKILIFSIILHSSIEILEHISHITQLFYLWFFIVVWVCLNIYYLGVCLSKYSSNNIINHKFTI